MNPPYLRWPAFILAAVVCLACGLIAVAADEPNLTKEQIKKFLLTANVVNSRYARKGVTDTLRLTLSDGTVSHDASFQTVDEHKPEAQFASGTEYNFADSYKYNIAAYELAELLGLDDMLPVYVERKWRGELGSLSWWLPAKMDEAERFKKQLNPPDIDAWNNQMHKIRVFDQLVSDSDPSLMNIQIGEDWKIWRIDFDRAFRLNKEPKNPDKLVRCYRRLFEKLKALDANALTEATKHYLNKNEVNAVMARRDKIVALFQQRIAEKGENEVLY